MNTARVPHWLKVPKPLAYYKPEQLLFIPQRRITWMNGHQYLLDYSDCLYRLAECREPRIERLQGCTLFISDSGYCFSITKQGDFYCVSDGVKRAYWTVAPKDDTTATLATAHSLAAMFAGHVVSEEDEPCQ